MGKESAESGVLERVGCINNCNIMILKQNIKTNIIDLNFVQHI